MSPALAFGVMLLAMLCGCVEGSRVAPDGALDADTPPMRDAGGADIVDAGRDAAGPLDAGGVADAPNPSPDAQPPSPDAVDDVGSDGGSETGPDAGGTPCEVNGVMGECVDVADCLGQNMAVAGFCPGPANIQCCLPASALSCDESDMRVPEASFVESPGDLGCPNAMVSVDNFCIDRFECALVELVGGREVPHSPFFNPGSKRVKAVSVEGAVPQAYISQEQASAACLEAGKRLCTDDEWLRACQGPEAFVYPYGDLRRDGLCNDARSVHPAVEYFGSNDPSIFSQLDNPCLNQLPGSLDAAGSNALCRSAEGTFDMMGNLHEWTANPQGVFRGGFYVDTVRNGQGCLYRTSAHAPSYHDYSTGFRCCF